MKKETLARKKKNTRIICYVSLVVLVILLLLPPALRLFTTSTETHKVEEKEGIVLSCEKANESINSTFLNGEPQSILYKIKGNYLDEPINNPDEEIDYLQDPEDTNIDNNVKNNTTDSTLDSNAIDNDSNVINEQPIEVNLSDKSVFTLLKPFSSIEYDEATNITSLRITVPNLKNQEIYQNILKSVTDQESYFKSQDFSCSKTTV